MRLEAWAVAGATAALVACGGGGGGGGGSGSVATCTPGQTAATTITATGLTPLNVCIRPTGVVTFRNDDTAAHQLVPETAPCPSGGLPSVAPGASVDVTFPTSGNCTFHDSAQPANAAFRGTVAVSQVTVSGGGY